MASPEASPWHPLKFLEVVSIICLPKQIILAQQPEAVLRVELEK